MTHFIYISRFKRYNWQPCLCAGEILVNNRSNEAGGEGDNDDVNGGNGDADAPSNEVLLMVQGRDSTAKKFSPRV